MQASRPLRVGITGISGQLGLHCRARMEHKFGYAVSGAGRDVFDDPGKLITFVSDNDVIIHLAATIKAPESEIDRVNMEIARRLMDAIAESGSKPHLINCSSIHNNGPTAYGKMKGAVSDFIQEKSVESEIPLAEVVLPNLFGEFSKPNHNNFSGTFCQKIVDGQSPTIIENRELEYAHYGEAADFLAKVASERSVGNHRVKGEKTHVETVAHKLQSFYDSYSQNVIPDFTSVQDVRLFNMLRHFVFAKSPTFVLANKEDNRGRFVECSRALGRGQTSFSTSLPGIVRGEHFHFDKVERFVVVSGTARITMRRVYSDEVLSFDVSGDEPVAIDMPTLYTHNIENTGKDELCTLFWVNEFFDPDNPDTWPEKVTLES